MVHDLADAGNKHLGNTNGQCKDCVSGCVSDVSDCISDCVSGWVNGFLRGCMSFCVICQWLCIVVDCDNKAAFNK